mmetsp:Transcript_8400/g.15272  ORF Transcript_8400/g.15272 Transcript_8400/m.15272 type:complete len:200 (+) Transcript_8400:949-1548(+)
MVIDGVEGVTVMVEVVPGRGKAIDIVRTMRRFSPIVFSLFVVGFSFRFWFLVLVIATLHIRSCIIRLSRKDTPRLDNPLLPTTIKHTINPIPKRHPTHPPRMRLQISNHLTMLQIPHPHRPIHAPAHRRTQISPTYRHARNGIDVSPLEFAHERLGEHSIELGGGDGAGVFAGAGLGVGGGVEVFVGGAEVVEGGAGGA